MAPRKKANKQQPPLANAPPVTTIASPPVNNSVLEGPAQDLGGYPEVQQNEYLATEAIYADGFLRLRGRKDAWKNQENLAFQLRLVCLENPDIFVKLDFEFAGDYPKVPLKVSIIEVQPQNEKLSLEIAKIVNNVPRLHLGSECVHEVTAPIDDLLNSAAVSKAAKENPFSLEEERAHREAAARLAAQRQEELVQQQQKEEAARTEKALVSKLESERKRREGPEISQSEEMVIKVEEVSTTSHVAEFDQPITVQDTLDNKDINFQAVDGRLVITRREDKLMVLVTPITADQTLNPPQLMLKKIYLPQNLASRDKLQRTMRHVEELLEQSRSQRHTNIIDLLAYKIIHPKTDDAKWELDILSEWAPEGSLEDFLVIAGPLAPSRIKDWTSQLVEALAFFDQHQFIHPAFHAGNVLIRRSSKGGITIKLSDGYGTALRDLVDKARQSKLASTTDQPFWIAPELNVSTENRTAQTCIWDLGKVVLQMALGQDVFDRYTSPLDCLNRKPFATHFRGFLLPLFLNEPTKRPKAFKLKSYQFFFKREPPIFQEYLPVRNSKGQEVDISTMRWERDWEPKELLGKGGFGRVVKAQNINDQGIYAIKIIKVENSKTLAEFRQEALMLKDLKHPSIVRYYATWTEQDITHASPSTSMTNEQDNEDEDDESDEAWRNSNRAPSTNLRSRAFDDADDFITQAQISQLPTGSEFESANNLFTEEVGFFAAPSADAGDDESDDYDNAFNNAGADANSGPEHQSDSDPFARSDPFRKINEEIVAQGSPFRRVKRAPPQTQEAETRSILYIQMEYCDQQTLAHLIKNRDLSSTPEEMWRLFRSVLEGLKYIHAQGIAHRDLKPMNIFLDSDNNPKIGDFGLATAAFAAHGSGDVGTPLYTAPELLQLIKLKDSKAGKLGGKVDMYSLGIIFLEMNYRFESVSERVFMLTALSQGEKPLPRRFEAEGYRIQGEIITALVKHDPEARPEASDLLERQDIPELIEEKKLQRYVQWVARTEPEKMQSWLKVGAYNEVQDLAWDYHGVEDRVMDPATVDFIVTELRDLFHRHGAISTSRGGIFPKVPQYDNAVTYLGLDGLPMQLPVDLTLPFARSIAHNKPAYPKCYAVGSIYRPRPNRTYGDEPIRVLEIDFDTVSYKTTDLALKDAMTIFVLDDVIHTFQALSSILWLILLNHNDLIDLVLSFCRIRPADFAKVKRQLGKLYAQGFTKEQVRSQWDNIRAVLRSASYNIPETSVASLSRFIHVVGDMDSVRQQLGKLLENESLIADAITTLGRLQEILTHLRRLQIRTSLAIAPLGTNSEQLYPGSVMFQCINGKAGILAAGGRYDNLIHHYQRGASVSATRAVGFRLSVGVIVNRLLAAANPSSSSSSSKLAKTTSRDKSASISSSLPAPTSSVSSPVPSRVDVLVTSFDPAALVTAGLDCLAVLLAGGVSAELTEEVASMEEIEEMYARDGAYWLVIVRGGMEGKVKVRKGKGKEGEEEVKVAELVGWLGRRRVGVGRRK